jgi:hypothetical protein
LIYVDKVLYLIINNANKQKRVPIATGQNVISPSNYSRCIRELGNYQLLTWKGRKNETSCLVVPHI